MRWKGVEAGPRFSKELQAAKCLRLGARVLSPCLYWLAPCCKNPQLETLNFELKHFHIPTGLEGSNRWDCFRFRVSGFPKLELWSVGFSM